MHTTWRFTSDCRIISSLSSSLRLLLPKTFIKQSVSSIYRSNYLISKWALVSLSLTLFSVTDFDTSNINEVLKTQLTFYTVACFHLLYSTFAFFRLLKSLFV